MSDFSTLQFFAAFKEQLEAIDTPPLSLALLTINADNYKELANDEAPDFSFAHIGIDHPSSDTTLLFSFEFFRGGVQFIINGFAPQAIDYAAIDPNPGKAAEKLMGLMIAVANGQISVLYSHTPSAESPQAVEIIYTKGERSRAVATVPLFAKPPKKGEAEPLKASRQYNEAEIPQVSLSKKLLELAIPPTEFPSYNRTFKGNAFPALQREDWEVSVRAHYDTKAEEIIGKMDSVLGIDTNASFKQQYLHFAGLRHSTLAYYLAILSMVYVTFGPPVSGLQVGLFAGIMAFAAASLFLRHPFFRQTLLRPLSYIVSVATIALIALGFDGSVLAIVIAVLAGLEILETVVLDIARVPTR